jgi:hypothetical protein
MKKDEPLTIKILDAMQYLLVHKDYLQSEEGKNDVELQDQLHRLRTTLDEALDDPRLRPRE